MIDRTPIKKSIAKNIKKYRKERNWFQHQLGFLAFGYTHKQKNAAHQRITKFETGRKEPYASELHLIAKALHVKITDLLDHS